MADGIVSFLLRTPIMMIFFGIMALIMALDEWRRANELNPQMGRAGDRRPGFVDSRPWLPGRRESWVVRAGSGRMDRLEP